MAASYDGVIAAEPDSANWEAAIAAALWNAGFLQQWQRTAACADEHEFCLYRSFCAAFEIVDLDIRLESEAPLTPDEKL